MQYRYLTPISAFFSILLLLATASYATPFGIRKDGKIDQAAISTGFKESEWEKVVTSLEGYLKENGDNRVSIEERIFAYKHLGVICAADSLTRSKAESYFTRMVSLSPDIEILDLYPSAKVLEIFQKSKQDYKALMDYSVKHDKFGRKTNPNDAKPIPMAAQKQKPTANQTIKSQPRETQVSEKNSTWIWWTLGIAAAAGLGTGAYYLTSGDAGVHVNSTDIHQKNESPSN